MMNCKIESCLEVFGIRFTLLRKVFESNGGNRRDDSLHCFPFEISFACEISFTPFELLHLGRKLSRLNSSFSFARFELDADQGFFTRRCSDDLCTFLSAEVEIVTFLDSNLNPLLTEAVPCPRPLVYGGCQLGERGVSIGEVAWSDETLGQLQVDSLSQLFASSFCSFCHHQNGSLTDVFSDILHLESLLLQSIDAHSSMKRLDPMTAIRIGEAKNPGPPIQSNDKFSLTCGLINPTAVRGKEQQLVDLDCHVFGLAENSATSYIQRTSSNQFWKHGFKSVWSPPVAAHQHVLREEEAKRGLASGVSVHSCLPCRPSRVHMPEHIDHTRLVSAIVQIEHWHLHIIVIYGYPSCHQQSRKRTNELLSVALELMAGVNMPTIIMGDFNWPLHQLPSASYLFSQGFENLADIYSSHYGEDMPYTCREVTRNDQILLSSHLSPLVRFARVDKQKQFHDHDPVIFQLELPLCQPIVSYWHLPTSWINYEPDVEKVAEHFEQGAKQAGLPFQDSDQHKCADLQSGLLLWTKKVEHAVDAAIRQQHQNDPEKFPQPFLPSNCRGRMKSRKLKHKPLSMNIKKACASQYDPPGEASSFRLKYLVTQTRRIQSLLTRMKKTSMIQGLWEEAINQMLLEWKAITKARGFPQGFPQWCISWPELNWYPLHLPPIDYLQVLEQLMCFHTDACSRQTEKANQRFHKFRLRHLDQMNKGSNLSKQVKISSASFDKLSTDQKTTVQVVENHGGLLTLLLSEKLLWRLDSPIMLDLHKAWIVSENFPNMDVMVDDADQHFPLNMTMTQTTFTQNAEDIANSLNDFWNQFWQRETTQPETDWLQFQEFLHQTPQLPMVQVDIRDGTLWKKAAQSMKSGTSRGVDGWYVDELKHLPLTAFDALGQLFHRFPGQAWPSHLMKALTVPLMKKDGVWLPHNTRPITILAVLYRLWGKVVTSQILAQWKQIMPDFIVGYIPARSPDIQMISQQFSFEIDNLEGISNLTSLQGVTLDLVKCFNLLPREPTKWALLRAGVPPELVQTWYDTMFLLHRCWKINGTIVELDKTSTGAPEGDTWSVLACISISRVWGHLVLQVGAQPSCFADNWGWHCRDVDINLQAIDITRLCAHSLRLQIDWEKTWAWKTNSANKSIWKRSIRSALPPEAKVQIVLHAKDLGFTMAYNKVQSRQTQAIRHKEAIGRLFRLRKLHATMQQRAKVVADAALAKALHATETYFVGRKWLSPLRSAMARTILPDRKNTNAYLTTMLVSSSVRDPELLVILRCIRACRRFLHASTQDIQLKFFTFASRHSGRPCRVFGPAGALQANLNRIGWSVDSSGFLHTDTEIKFSLLYSDLKELTLFLDRTWLKHVVQCCLTRPGWTNLPVPDRLATVKALCKLPDNEQQVLAYQITGSFMLANQKKHFNHQSDGCPLCSQEDTVEHRVLRCPSLQHVRHDFPVVTQFLHEHDSCHIELPIAYEDPLYELRFLYFQKCPHPVLDESVSQQIRQETDRGETPFFFTDGSCSDPKDCSKRRAAFAVVYHSEITSEQKASLLEAFRRNPVIPQSFVVLAVGECRGMQTINRAEFQAIMTIVANFPRGTIVTDSQYVLNMVECLKGLHSLDFLQGSANFDLFSSCWAHLRQGTFNFVKVAAHSLHEICENDSEAFHKLGNEAADQSAKLARHKFVYSESLYMDSSSGDALPTYDMILQFRYALQVARARGLQGQQAQDVHLRADRSFAAQINGLKNWQLDDCWQYQYLQEHDANLQYCLWGTRYAKQLLLWMSTLKWPQHKPDNRGCGITWYELALNFMLTMQVGLVANTSSDKKQLTLKRIPWEGGEIAFPRQVYFFERALTHLQTLIPVDILPFERQLASSTRLLGLTHGRQGLHRRPVMLHQDIVIDILVRHFAKGELPTESPSLPSLTPFQVVPRAACDDAHQGDWRERERMLKNWRKRMKGRSSREGGPFP